MSTIIELRRRFPHGIFAVPFCLLRPGRPVDLLDGAIVEIPTPDQRCTAPEHLDDGFEIAHSGVPATIHHVNLGLIIATLAFEGVYLLPSGDVVAVYGAESNPIN